MSWEMSGRADRAYAAATFAGTGRSITCAGGDDYASALFGKKTEMLTGSEHNSVN